MKKYFPSIKHYAWVILLCTLLAGLGGYLLSKSLPVTYQVNALMIVESGLPGNSFLPTVSSNDSLTQAINDASEIMSRSVMGYVYQSEPLLAARGYAADDLLSDITASIATTSSTITITATTAKSGDAVLLANAVANGYQMYYQQRLQNQLDAERKSLQDQYTAYQKQSQALESQILAVNNSADPRVPVWTSDRSDIVHNMDTVQAQLVQLPITVQSNVVVIQPAKLTDVAPSSKGFTLVAAATGMGLLVGVLVMLFLIFLENRLRDVEQVKEKIGLAYLGGLADNKNIKEDPAKATGAVIRQYADICANLQLTGVLPGQWRAPHGAVLLVTSTQVAEGKTTLTVALSATIARSGSTVVVVDGNLHKPSTHLAFGISVPGPGLSGLLKGIGRENVDEVVQRSNIPGVWLLPAGAEMNDATFLLEQKLPNILMQLRKKADIVIIDGPALLEGADASILAALADGVALLVDVRHDKIPYLLRAKELLSSVAHTRAGVVMNRLSRKQHNNYYATAYAGGAPTEKWVPVQAHTGNGNGNGYGSDASNGKKYEPVVEQNIVRISSPPPSGLLLRPDGPTVPVTSSPANMLPGLPIPAIDPASSQQGLSSRTRPYRPQFVDGGPPPSQPGIGG